MARGYHIRPPPSTKTRGQLFRFLAKVGEYLRKRGYYFGCSLLYYAVGTHHPDEVVMIQITIWYSAQHNIDNTRAKLQFADLYGWRVEKEEIRRAETLGEEVLQTLSLVPVRGGRVTACPPDLIIAIATVAKGQWGEIFETKVVSQ